MSIDSFSTTQPLPCPKPLRQSRLEPFLVALLFVSENIKQYCSVYCLPNSSSRLEYQPIATISYSFSMTSILLFTMITLACMGFFWAVIGAIVFAPLLVSLAAASVGLWGFALVTGMVYRSRIKAKVNKLLGRQQSEVGGVPTRKLTGRLNLRDDRNKWKFINEFNAVGYLSERERRIVSGGLEEVKLLRKKERLEREGGGEVSEVAEKSELSHEQQMVEPAEIPEMRVDPPNEVEGITNEEES